MLMRRIHEVWRITWSAEARNGHDGSPVKPTIVDILEWWRVRRVRVRMMKLMRRNVSRMQSCVRINRHVSVLHTLLEKDKEVLTHNEIWKLIIKNVFVLRLILSRCWGWHLSPWRNLGKFRKWTTRGSHFQLFRLQVCGMVGTEKSVNGKEKCQNAWLIPSKPKVLEAPKSRNCDHRHLDERRIKISKTLTDENFCWFFEELKISHGHMFTRSQDPK